MSDLLQNMRRLQSEIFKATKRGDDNWIRFADGSPLHEAIANGEVKGVTMQDATRDDGGFILKTAARTGAQDTAQDAPPPACVGRALGASMILKHSPSLLPGDCVRRDPHDCALEKPESEPVKPPRVGTYVRVRWYHVEGLMLVFNVRDSLSRWEIDADQADLPDDRGDYLDGVFLDGWITQEGSIADNGECDRGRPTWARGVPHKSVPRASGSERSTRWEHISE